MTSSTRAGAATKDARPAHLLEIRDLVVRFSTDDGTVYAVNGVNLFVDHGETLAVVGESGSGKSVTSLAVVRLLPATATVTGEIIFDGVRVTELPERSMRAIRGRDIAMVFQDPMTSLNPVLRIGEQIEETIRAHGGPDAKQRRGRAIELLGFVGIPRPEEQLRRYPHEFSGGMRQRVMIAMALALEPKILIADEPTTALDATIQAQVLELLAKLTSNTGTAVVLITHDLGIIARMAQRVAVMYAGSIVESASTTAMFARPRHPYTVGLLHSIPRLDAERGSLRPIEGAPPDLRQEPSGCPFAPRCAWRLDVCWEEMPPLEPVDAGHAVACHNPVTSSEAALGRPDRPGFAAAPPPGDAS